MASLARKYLRVCAALGAVAAFCILGSARAEDNGATARGMFILLPTSIFELTPEGLSDAEKQDLLTNGKSGHWEIADETPDAMLFNALPGRDRSIGLRVFRNNVDGSTDVAIGTLGEPVCGLELWRQDLAGRILPIDGPEEPKAGEFFAGARKISGRIHSAVIMCLAPEGLKALPIFWNDLGMLPARLDNEIVYQWNGSGFVKKSRPIPPNRRDPDPLP